MDRLFFKYLAPLLVISIIPVVCSGLLLFFLIKTNMIQLRSQLVTEISTNLQREIALKNEALAYIEGLQLEQRIDRIGDKMNAMVVSPDFINLQQVNMTDHIDNIMQLEQSIYEIIVVDEFGDPIIQQTNSASLVSDEAETLYPAELLLRIQQRQPYFSDVSFSNRSQSPHMILAIPIFDFASNFIGGLIVKVDLAFLSELSAAKEVGEGGFLYLISSKGMLISHPDKKELNQNVDYSKYDFINRIISTDKGTTVRENNLLSYHKNKYGWTTIVEIPISYALSSVKRNEETISNFIGTSFRSISYTTVIVILFVLIMSSISAIFITKMIIAPIINLTQATSKVREGNLNIRIERKSNDEIGELTDSFNLMIEELKKNRDELVNTNQFIKKQAEELLDRYNSDLEQFAYVTTHDLIEPLRMITSYVQLLQRKYRDVFDNEAREFMTYVIEGVERMHVIINDLFEYSHIRTNIKDFEEVDFLEAFEVVTDRLHKEIADSQAEIKCHELPKTKAVRSNIVQLFQNLISNAIKFKSKNRPLLIEIISEDKGLEYLITLRDNGIGFEPKYSDKVFEIFKRLNKRNEFKGSGMGLAICKNIVERHGGRIWVEPIPDEGCTFYFTIRKY